LDNDDSLQPSSGNSSSKKQKPRTHVAVMMDTISTNIASVRESIDVLTTERRIARLQVPSQATQELTPSSTVGEEAIERLQQVESHLDPDRMIALLDRFQRDPNAAKAYMTLKREDYRKAWVSKRLAEEGFVEGITVDE
jgi:hypothetical protein